MKLFCTIVQDVSHHYSRRSSQVQCVAVCCSVLQCVAVCCSVLQYAVVCCIVLQFCSVLQCVALKLFCTMAQDVSHHYSRRSSQVQRVAVCCSMLQYVVVCCSVSQCVAVCCSVL